MSTGHSETAGAPPDGRASVELVYFRDCPHVDTARRRLCEALDRAGLPPRWSEWEVEDPGTPHMLRGWPSPTILIEGRSVRGGEPPGNALACHAEGAPSVLLILAALGLGRARG